MTSLLCSRFTLRSTSLNLIDLSQLDLKESSGTCLYCVFYCFSFSFPLLKKSRTKLIIYPCSGVRPSSSVVRPFTISNIFFSQIARPVKAKFCVEPLWVGGTKVCSRHLGHMTKMAAMPIYGKNPSKNLLLRNQLSDFHETWCVAYRTPANNSLFK